jgi:16S rRNA (uracil1498-N3)-methyltransferase
MSAPRFYVDPAQATLAEHAEVTLPEVVARHATQVLRLRKGDAVVLFDGRGGEYAGTLDAVGKHSVVAVGAHAAVERESPLAVRLVQSLVAHDVMDWIVRKAVELGAAAVEPVVAARSQRGPAERMDRRVARWQQIAIAACEQCGRNRVPLVAAPLRLPEWLELSVQVPEAVMLEPRASASLASEVARAAPSAVLIGPEGGFTDEEVQMARAAGVRSAHVGPRTLRAETAALAALATLEAVGGDAR